jgi:GNAT superfamily N-acetyltransferase
VRRYTALEGDSRYVPRTDDEKREAAQDRSMGTTTPAGAGTIGRLATLETVSVRRAEAAHDWRVARRLLREYFDWVHGQDDLPPTDRAVVRADGRTPALSFTSPNRFFIASRHPHGDADDIGCVGVRVFRSSAELTRLYVRPFARGLGAARALVQAAIADITVRRVDRLRLDAHPRVMPAAFQLYRDLGFVVTGPMPGVDGGVSMQLSLPRSPT